MHVYLQRQHDTGNLAVTFKQRTKLRNKCNSKVCFVVSLNVTLSWIVYSPGRTLAWTTSLKNQHGTNFEFGTRNEASYVNNTASWFPHILLAAIRTYKCSSKKFQLSFTHRWALPNLLIINFVYSALHYKLLYRPLPVGYPVGQPDYNNDQGARSGFQQLPHLTPW